ncbi:hypothetical protein Lal_00041456 [Lupinus albus]|uniref:Putative bifunctional inhibitor/plant lipid transfer protein/seed storage helical n=1 Tax=Lupinus albus TaxID=3870 RepID=A0A6A5MU97_LUPAL|nr:putative bifunctional inhibitor/plant lipid transfer protein/seed storage helical [Lupinus albus]KAF1874015.1 hypothetical protein Lal_00041456 [Lupinus albus]
MASKATLVISLNILFFTLVSSTYAQTPKEHEHGCPVDALRFNTCAVFGWIHVPYGHPCCHLIQFLEGKEAAECLCTAIKTNVLGVPINSPKLFNYIFNKCGKIIPENFECS